jgi:hypothetical protein
MRYRYYVSRPLIADDQTDRSAGLRIPAGEIEQAVTSRLRQWLVDPGSVYQAIRLADPSAQRRLIARAVLCSRRLVQKIRTLWTGCAEGLVTHPVYIVALSGRSSTKPRKDWS